MIGGVVGEARGAVDATNAGNIVVNGLSASMRSSIGGVVGTNYGVEVSGTNSGSITVSSGSSFTDTFFLGGVVGFGQGDISSCTNNGSVSNAGSVTGDGKYIQVGGIVGYNNDSSVLSNCTNNGDVTNSGSSAGYVYVGGITSETDANITSCINNGSVSNSGEATTQKTSTKIYHVEVGGISGHNASVTLTSCSNSGSVSNTGDSGAGIFIGGISGHSKAATFVTCSNSGAVSNSGYPYDSNFIFDVCIAGLVGYLDGNVTLTGTSSQYNSNSGSITESSTSGYVAIGGIAGANSGSSTDLAYAKNLDGGDIYYIGNTRYRSFIGGVLGCCYAMSTMDNASNAGDINFSNITVDKNENGNDGQVHVGGVLGGFWSGIKSTAGTFNNLTNSGKISSPENNLLAADTDVSSWSYIGGVSGVGDCTNKTFLNCGNSGEIYVYNNLKTRLGGVLGYTNINPTGCWCHENIRYLRQDVTDVHISGLSVVGGVVGYLNLATVSGLSYEGTLNTRSSYGGCYTGGIIGLIGDAGKGDGKITTFDSCRIAGKVQGAGTGYNTGGPGLFTTRNNNETWYFTFPSCVVRTGTVMSAKNNYTITTDNVNTWVVGRYAPTSITTAPTVGSWSW